jgi:triacylglycerol lipase
MDKLMASRARDIVFVHGFGGWGPKDLGGRFPYWGEALHQYEAPFRVHEAKCGPLSSLHDRACELFAQIVGARIDYGEAHSLSAGHARHSRDYSGLGFVPNWSANNPIVLVGHSAGAPTALLLQKLLDEDFWGVGSSADWIEAIVCVCGALNGSTFAYRFCDDATGRMTGLPSAFVSSSLAVLAQLLGLAATPLFDLHLEHWIGAGDDDPLGALRRLDATRFVASEDNLVHDMSLQGAIKTLARCRTFPDTYYLSLVARATKPTRRFGLPFGPATERPDRSMSLSQRYAGLYICNRPDFAAAPIDGWGAGDLGMAAWRANDGCVNSISQRYPFLAGTHPVSGAVVVGPDQEIAPGAWRYQEIEEVVGRKFDHIDPVHGAFRRPARGVREAHRRLHREIAATLARLPASG